MTIKKDLYIFVVTNGTKKIRKIKLKKLIDNIILKLEIANADLENIIS